MHALSARPLKVQGGREFSLSADGTTVISLISLCSHPVPHPSLNREARHSLTWHSSKSESALERFEPVAVVQQLPDGRGTLFAPVAARRQKVFKRGKRSSFCPFRSFRTSEKNTAKKVSSSFLRVVEGIKQCAHPQNQKSASETKPIFSSYFSYERGMP